MASKNYQEAYSLSWSLQLFGAAAEALTKLGKLYQTYKQDDYALQIYQNLIQVEQLSYNYYGLMRTYETIGEIYLAYKQYDVALEFFKQGLILAQSLNYKQDNFLSRIEQTNRKIRGEDEPEPPQVNPDVTNPNTLEEIPEINPDLINPNTLEEIPEINPDLINPNTLEEIPEINPDLINPNTLEEIPEINPDLINPNPLYEIPQLDPDLINPNTLEEIPQLDRDWLKKGNLKNRKN